MAGRDKGAIGGGTIYISVPCELWRTKGVGVSFLMGLRILSLHCLNGVELFWLNFFKSGMSKIHYRVRLLGC